LLFSSCHAIAPQSPRASFRAELAGVCTATTLMTVLVKFSGENKKTKQKNDEKSGEKVRSGNIKMIVSA
jgi:hypothetical protein